MIVRSRTDGLLYEKEHLSYATEMAYKWMYIDFNSYFASVEQELQPRLRGKPIAVVPVDTDSTCAIAASYEAKRFGIKTGTPIYEAKKLCPSLICVLANHKAYVDFHHRLIAEIGRHVPIAKVCSIDEVACELMENESQKAQELALKIKKGIAERVGVCLTCSIGFAPNRYLAKVASDMQKPNGLTFLDLPDLPHKLFSLSLRDLPGIGSNMELRLKRFGIFDMKTLCGLSLAQIKKAWGSVLGERLFFHLRGTELPDLETKRTSLGHSQVLAPELRPPEEARKVAIRLVLKAASRLRKEGYVAGSFSLSLRTEENARYECSSPCSETSDSITFLALLEKMWQELLNKMDSVRIKKVSIVFTELSIQESMQEGLFPKELRQKKRESLSAALDAVNERYGKDSLLLGILPKDGSRSSRATVAFSHIPDEEEFS